MPATAAERGPEIRERAIDRLRLAKGNDLEFVWSLGEEDKGQVLRRLPSLLTPRRHSLEVPDIEADELDQGRTIGQLVRDCMQIRRTQLLLQAQLRYLNGQLGFQPFLLPPPLREQPPVRLGSLRSRAVQHLPGNLSA